MTIRRQLLNYPPGVPDGISEAGTDSHVIWHILQGGSVPYISPGGRSSTAALRTAMLLMGSEKMENSSNRRIYGLLLPLATIIIGVVISIVLVLI